VSDVTSFVVYACEVCGKRIFTERAHLGRRGVCPICGCVTTVGGRDARRGGSSPARAERRRARRFRVSRSTVTAGRGPGTEPLPALKLCVVEDLSEGGVGFLAPGTKDRKKITGYAPPALAVGDEIALTLHVGRLGRPLELKGCVRRVSPHPLRHDVFRVGVEFLALGLNAKNDLKRLAEKGSDTGSSSSTG
jgi:hypothetical protein